MKGIVLGCGNMSRAVVQGLSSVLNFNQTYFYTPSKTKAQKLAQDVGGIFLEDLSTLPEDPEFVFLACKPQQFSDLAKSLKGKFKTNPLFISILAATSLSLHEELLGSTRILRVMPNMPVKFKTGVSLLIASASVTKAEKDQWQNSLNHIGVTKWTQNEKEFDQLMLLCGSGPAFMYQWLKWLAEMSPELNFDECQQLAISVMEGSLASIKEQKDKDLQTLINEVTSKGGVTAAVLSGWEKENISASLKNGWNQGLTRVDEITQIILQSK